MATFHTPEPITADIEVAAGMVHLTAGDGADTVVEVRPHDAARPADVKAAEQTRVTFHHGRLSVKTPMPWIMLGRRASVDIDIALPSGSRLTAAVASAGFQADGEYADCRLASASGGMLVESVSGNIKADTASGDITVHRASGPVAVATASGNLVVGELDSDLRFQTASGTLTVDRLCGNAKCQSASGGVAVAVAVSGSLSVQTASGEVEVGIPHGTAAELDLRTRSGAVTNTLQPADGPVDDDRVLAVSVHTASGDIAVRRASSAGAAR
ncbi:DUF4097 family beta strand repeat protein [Mycolicibacterium sp. S2-37]|uniref:DUF4097 family beta strand repeat-containing protein n=1 Tax=Mycolicibacterium sp. S2-37 TaxID=2810297 RepID=UPI001A94FF9A|nr:DUF4097 family beta strand repeat-containing protein [Mycolicibacterium sp. S2-37]MBO0677052.1 DUF4097 family beta strand repeat protein [Mycolicibacterium sp. S2-37]